MFAISESLPGYDPWKLASPPYCEDPEEDEEEDKEEDEDRSDDVVYPTNSNGDDEDDWEDMDDEDDFDEDE